MGMRKRLAVIIAGFALVSGAAQAGEWLQEIGSITPGEQVMPCGSTGNQLLFATAGTPGNLYATNGQPGQMEIVAPGWGNSFSESFATTNGIYEYLTPWGAIYPIPSSMFFYDSRNDHVQFLQDFSSDIPNFRIHMNGDVMYFGARELWRTNGLSSGTYVIKDISGAGDTNPQPLGVLNTILLFAGSDQTGARGIWRTNGSEAGTRLVKQVEAKNTLLSNIYLAPEDLTAVCGNYLLFSGWNPEEGWELWRSDGTASGTQQIDDLYPDLSSSNPRGFANVGASAVFFADLIFGTCLMVTDGTVTNTNVVLELGEVLDGPVIFARANNIVYFSLLNSLNEVELWATDGTEDGTYLLKSRDSANDLSPIRYFGELDGRVLFTVEYSNYNRQLVSTKGTLANTIPLRQFSSSAFRGVRVGKAYYFRTESSTHVFETWRTDGTPAGTAKRTISIPGYVQLLGSVQNKLIASSYLPQATTLYAYFDSANTGARIWTQYND